jgi:hypothetical protein
MRLHEGYLNSNELLEDEDYDISDELTNPLDDDDELTNPLTEGFMTNMFKKMADRRQQKQNLKKDSEFNSYCEGIRDDCHRLLTILDRKDITPANDPGIDMYGFNITAYLLDLSSGDVNKIYRYFTKHPEVEDVADYMVSYININDDVVDPDDIKKFVVKNKLIAISNDDGTGDKLMLSSVGTFYTFRHEDQSSNGPFPGTSFFIEGSINDLKIEGRKDISSACRISNRSIEDVIIKTVLQLVPTFDVSVFGISNPLTEGAITDAIKNSWSKIKAALTKKRASKQDDSDMITKAEWEDTEKHKALAIAHNLINELNNYIKANKIKAISVEKHGDIDIYISKFARLTIASTDAWDFYPDGARGREDNLEEYYSMCQKVTSHLNSKVNSTDYYVEWDGDWDTQGISLCSKFKMR